MRVTVVLLLVLLCSGCGDAPDSKVADTQTVPAQATSTETTAGPGQLTARQMQQWSGSCALCHVAGVAGAPVIGGVEEWQPRLAQGRETLLAHTIEGFNSMPPLGYCMSCEREDFSAMIDFMLGGAL